MTTPAPVLVARLDEQQVAAVHDLVHDVAAADGVAPLSEHVLLHLPEGGDVDVRHLLVERAGELVAYAHLDVTDPVAGPSAELAVRPSARGTGLGRSLVEQLVRLSPDGRLRLWAHGSHPASAALATAMGFASSRVLLQMRRSLLEPLPDPVLPAGISVRTFRVGQDEAAFLRVNARAFAAHPEQGRWGLEEVLLREAEPWFDAAGFFLAERAGDLVGFHWTKVHGGDGAEGAADADGHAHEPIGEVYVVGVDPSAQGLGLGPALTLVGLHWLRERGLTSVLLYADESNAAAVRVYERLGFTRWSTDVSWSRG